MRLYGVKECRQYIYLAVMTQNWTVTDEQTDRQTALCTASYAEAR